MIKILNNAHKAQLLKEIEEKLVFIPTDEMEYRYIRFLLDLVRELEEQNKNNVAFYQHENARLREALEWYADYDNYMECKIPISDEGTIEIRWPFVMNDRGTRARAALGRE